MKQHLPGTENDRGANQKDPLPRFDNYLRPNIFGANDIGEVVDFGKKPSIPCLPG